MKRTILLLLTMFGCNVAYGASVDCYFSLGTQVADNKFYGYVSQDRFEKLFSWEEEFVYPLTMELIGKLETGNTILIEDDPRIGKVYLKVFKDEFIGDEIRAVSVQTVEDTAGDTESGFYMNIFNGTCEISF